MKRWLFIIIMFGFTCRATTAEALTQSDLDLIVRTMKKYVDLQQYEECKSYLKTFVFKSPEQVGQRYFFMYGREAYREMKPVWNSMKYLDAWDLTLQQLIAAKIALPYNKKTHTLDLRGFNIVTLADLVTIFAVQFVMIDRYSSLALIPEAKRLGIEIVMDDDSPLSVILEQNDGSFRKKRYSLPAVAVPAAVAKSAEAQTDAKKSASVRSKRFSLLRNASSSDQ
jgi:hypothetical protein